MDRIYWLGTRARKMELYYETCCTTIRMNIGMWYLCIHTIHIYYLLQISTKIYVYGHDIEFKELLKFEHFSNQYKSKTYNIPAIIKKTVIYI